MLIREGRRYGDKGGIVKKLEKEMATHSSILTWRIPWTEKPGRLQSTGSRRVRHDWATSLHFTLLECEMSAINYYIITLHGKEHFVDVIKLRILRWGDNPNYPSYCNHRVIIRVLIWERQQDQSQRERSEDATLWPLEMKEGIISWEILPRSWKRQGSGFSWRASRGMQPCPHLDLG